MDISKRINEIRNEKKITITELAENIGITYAGLNKAFKNNDFKISMLEKIANQLHVPIVSFFKNEINDNLQDEVFVLRDQLSGDLFEICLIEFITYYYYKLIYENQVILDFVDKYYKEEIEENLKMELSNVKSYNINGEQIPLDESYINRLKNTHIAYFIIDKKNKKDKRIKEIKKELNNINNELSSYIYNKNIIVNWLLKNNIISNESIAGYIASAVTNDDSSGSGSASEMY